MAMPNKKKTPTPKAKPASAAEQHVEADGQYRSSFSFALSRICIMQNGVSILMKLWTNAKRMKT